MKTDKDETKNAVDPVLNCSAKLLIRLLTGELFLCHEDIDSAIFDISVSYLRTPCLKMRQRDNKI